MIAYGTGVGDLALMERNAPPCWESGCGRRKDKARPLIRVTALCCL